MKRCECGQYPDVCDRYGHAGGKDAAREDQQDRARELVTNILRQGDYIVPFVSAHLDDLRMDSELDQVVVDELAARMRLLLADIVELRAISHGGPT